mmetsp:Transcript_41200/g.74476  ORF Transcript_41200/g.74476 Transcript_41200/m.74476 type:complete len:257 (+) Transcript_41200:79-849(+)
MPVSLDTVGFCGVDDSVDPAELVTLSNSFPWIEWGILCQPGHEGTPRNPTPQYVERLGQVLKASGARVAAHMCGGDATRVMRGDVERIQQVSDILGCRRIQVNLGTAPWEKEDGVDGLCKVVTSFPSLEFILQTTKKVEDELLPILMDPAVKPRNLAVLYDPSVGTGVEPPGWPAPLADVHCGYAGGLSPERIEQQLHGISNNSVLGYSGTVWIDMESSLRSKLDDGQDIFDLERVRQVIDKVVACEDAVIVLSAP